MNALKSMGLKAKILSIVAFACLLCALISVFVASHFCEVTLEEGIVDKAKTVHSRLDAATEYIALQGGLKPIVDSVTSRHKGPDEISQNEKLDILKQVPIFAAMKIGAKNAEKEHFQFRVFSDEPRRKENLSTPQELAILKRFEADPQLVDHVAKDGDILTVYRPVRLSEAQGCLTCHGAPESSPWHNGKDVLGYPMENWKDGKLHGVFAISSKISEIKAVQAQTRVMAFNVQIGLFVAAGALIALMLAAYLVRDPMKRLDSAMKSVTLGAEEVGAAIAKIQNVSHELTTSTNQQAEAVQETASTIDQISSTIKKSADNATSSKDSSELSKDKARKGQEVVVTMSDSVSQINQMNEKVIQEIDLSNQRISEIVQVIQEIESKTKVINDIVFQTKLLSFNASVEAARAGEQGKGFAVVAEEVGNLARSSGTAAQEISVLLEESIKKVEFIAQDTKSRVGNIISSAKLTVEESAKVAGECGQVLHEIVSSSTEVSQMVSVIADAAEEQSKGVSEVSKAIYRIEKATQTSTGAAEKCTLTANELAAQIEQLREVASSLKVLVDGEISKAS